ncbi:MAG: WbqC family protein [Bacteroidaceae bacterium]|nr:WbqC family protein [Bacteroidaceae bacterium]
MRIAVMQPYFFPYIGYWQLIHAVDLFVVGDSVHYIRHGWINRNRILGEGKQPQYFGIEVSHASANRRINEMTRVVDRKRADYLCRVLKFYYERAPHYSEAMEVIRPILLDEEPDLTRYLTGQLRAVAEYLGVRTEFRMLSEVADRWDCCPSDIIRLTCEHFGFTNYINPSGAGMSYYDKNYFRKMGINLQFLRRDEKIRYPQFGGNFVPDLSIIDLLMFCSVDEIRQMLDEYYFL